MPSPEEMVGGFGAAEGLAVTGVSKLLGGTQVVSDLSLVVPRGQLVCLLGPSGCGKTTTLRMIAGFLHPDIGHITIDGMDVTDLPPEDRPTAMVFQNYALWPHMTVFKNVAFGLRLRKLPKREVNDRVMAVLKLVNLERARDRHPTVLSGGEQQRVALARAIVLEPKLLLLDEPLSNLDAKLRVVVREEIREIQQRLGIAMVFVTHDQDEALSIADRVAVMSGGRIEQFADPETLYARPETSFVAGFVGSMNFFQGRLSADGVVVGAGAVFVPCGQGCFAGLAGTDGNWEVAVRPEDVVVEHMWEAGRGTSATPVKQVAHGHFREVVLSLGDGGVEVRAYVSPGFDLSGPLTARFGRGLLYREGMLVHEFNGAREVVTAGPRDLDNRGAGGGT
jgi:putative spermidine/putrescine transport system ATP-binding protein